MMFTDFERIGQPLATRRLFIQRLGRNLGLAIAVIGASLVVGMLGYIGFEGLGVVDAYAHAAMILSGMGPYNQPATNAGKIFEGTYALYSGLVVVATTALVLSPIFHRVMHGLHVPDEEDEEKDAKRKPGRRTTDRQSGRAG